MPKLKSDALPTELPRGSKNSYIKNLKKKKKFYLLMIDTEREWQTQAEGEAGSPQGAGCGIHGRSPGSPGQKAGTEPLSHPGTPKL